MPHISLSHTKGIVCCAVSRKNVGIDAEYPRRVRGVPQSASVRPQSFGTYKAAPIPPRAFWRTGRSKRASPSARHRLSGSFQNYEITFQNGMPHLNGYTLFFEQYGVHFLAAAEEA